MRIEVGIMLRKTSLKNALDKASAGTKKVAKMPATEQKDSRVAQPPSRQGKKAITGHFDPAVSRQLKQIALDHDTTVQALLGEALNDLFVKYKQNPIASNQ